ncbi:hypothetical protein AAMO2058_000489500 [Amorphochlora amoebiformis]
MTTCLGSPKGLRQSHGRPEGKRHLNPTSQYENDSRKIKDKKPKSRRSSAHPQLAKVKRSMYKHWFKTPTPRNIHRHMVRKAVTYRGDFFSDVADLVYTDFREALYSIATGTKARSKATRSPNSSPPKQARALATALSNSGAGEVKVRLCGDLETIVESVSQAGASISNSADKELEEIDNRGS